MSQTDFNLVLVSYLNYSDEIDFGMNCVDLTIKNSINGVTVVDGVTAVDSVTAGC